MAFMMDCQEDSCKQRLIEELKQLGKEEDVNSVSHRINVFKETCLPAAKCLDDRAKLVVVGFDKETELFIILYIIIFFTINIFKYNVNVIVEQCLAIDIRSKVKVSVSLKFLLLHSPLYLSTYNVYSKTCD